MDKNIPATHSLQKDPFGGVVEKAEVDEGDVAAVPQDDSQGVVLDDVETAVLCRGYCPYTQSITQGKICPPILSLSALSFNNFFTTILADFGQGGWLPSASGSIHRSPPM